MVNPLTEEVRAGIAKNIDIFGVSIVAVSDAYAVRETDPDKMFSESDDGFIYTVGHKAYDLPELLVFCGPGPKDSPMCADEMIHRIREASLMVNDILSKWYDEMPVNKGIVRSASGRMFAVLENPDPPNICKENYMKMTTAYHDGDEYAITLLMPL